MNTDQCFFLRNFTELMRVLAFVRLTLCIRICVDPILSFITDFQIRRGFLALIGVKRKITFSSSRGIFQRTQEENSSEGPPSNPGSRKEISRVDGRPTSQKKLCTFEEKESIPHETTPPPLPPTNTSDTNSLPSSESD